MCRAKFLKNLSCNLDNQVANTTFLA
jgi:hypothetical protein